MLIIMINLCSFIMASNSSPVQIAAAIQVLKSVTDGFRIFVDELEMQVLHYSSQTFSAGAAYLILLGTVRLVVSDTFKVTDINRSVTAKSSACLFAACCLQAA